MGKPKGKNKKQHLKKKKGGYGAVASDGEDDSTSRKGNQKKKGRANPKGKKPKGNKGADDDAFRATLLAEGNRILNEMHADGNCLFRSLSDQLYNDFGGRHDHVRKEVCDFLEKNEEDFSVFLLLEDHDEDVTSFEDYVSRMRQDGEWGGNVELVSAARLYERNVTVFSPVGAFSIASGHEQTSGYDLLLSYHDNGHYNSIKDEKLQKPVKQSPVISGNAKAKGDKITRAKNSDETSPEAKVDISGKMQKQGSCRQQRRNDACSCGSGLRYKKCCLAREKHQARITKLREKHGDEDDNGQESKEDALEGNFKVLKI